MLGAGRPAIKPEITSTSALTKADIDGFIPAKVAGKVATFRDSHHMVARLFALGLRPGEVASRSGYSLSRISTLSTDPAFKELVAVYRKDVNEEFREAADEYFETITANRVIAARRLNDMLSDEEREFTPSQLVAIHSDSADRTGYPKRTVAVNVNVDFAARLERAVQRSKSIQALPAPSHQGSAAGGGPGEATAVEPPRELKQEVLPPLRRRA